MRLVGTARAALTEREHGLDLVRAAAISWVMLYHANTMGLIAGGPRWLITFGWMGVDLFFVLSGFLIGNQLLKPFVGGSRPSYGQFFARRAFRTLPAFLVVLFFYFALPALRESRDIQPVWQFITFTENLFFDTSSPKAFDHVWSLCVEEQFYLLFALAVAAISIRPSVRTVALALFLILVGGVSLRTILWLAYLARHAPDPAGQVDWHGYVSLIYYPTWCRLDGLLAGVSLALLKNFRPNGWNRLVSRPDLILTVGILGLLTAMAIFAGVFGSLIAVAIGFPTLSLAVALIVAAATTGKALIGRFRIPGGEALATGAYSLYLTHKIAFHATKTWVAPQVGLSGNAELALAFTVAVGSAALLYWTVERPFLQLRRRLLAPVRDRNSIARHLGSRRGLALKSEASGPAFRRAQQTLRQVVMRTTRSPAAAD